jgi:hypothetical protein
MERKIEGQIKYIYIDATISRSGIQGNIAIKHYTYALE